MNDTTSNLGLQYQQLYGSESASSYGSFGIKILVAGSNLPDFKLNAIWGAAYDAAEKIKAEVQAARIAADPKAQEYKLAERAQLLGLFPWPIFVEEIKNGYSGDAWYSRHLPWFVVTTTVGRFTIGWRKRVISIDWSETVGTKTAEQLFASENVTKGERSIHAWTIEDARRYIAAVIESAK